MTVRRARLCIPAVILLGAALLSLPGTSAAAERAARPGDTVDTRAKLLPPGAKDQRLALKRARQAVRSANDALAADQLSAVGDQKFWLAARRRQRPVCIVKHLHAARDREQHRGLGRERRRTRCRPRPTSLLGTAATTACGPRSPTSRSTYLIDQFDNNIYPNESDDVQRRRRIATARRLGPTAAEPRAARRTTTPGDGDDIVALVDNVRDENFYDTNNAQTVLVHRRVLLVAVQRAPRPQRDDDRRVRLAAPHRRQPAARAVRRPVHERAGTAVPVRGRLRARVPAPARVLRGPGESDLGQRGPRRLGADAHRLRRPDHPDHGPRTSTATSSASSASSGCRRTFNPIPRRRGPENSLNLWGDQNDFESEILCDYGAAYTMMELLADRFGTGVHG